LRPEDLVRTSVFAAAKLKRSFSVTEISAEDLARYQITTENRAQTGTAGVFTLG
jgi:hypothetical protein